MSAISIAKQRKISAEWLRENVDYDAETGVFTWKKRGMGRMSNRKAIGSVDSSGYRKIKMRESLYSCHRLAWLYVHGDFRYVERDRPLSIVTFDRGIGNAALSFGA